MNPSNPNQLYGNSGYDARNRFTLTATYLIPGKKSPGQMLEGWQLNSAVTLTGGLPINVLDTSDDLPGTGENAAGGATAPGFTWTLVGDPSSFKIGSTATLPCYGVTGSTFAKSCTTEAVPAGAVIGTAAYVSNMPAACQNAATAEPTNPSVPSSDANSTGLKALANFGCYAEGNAVIIPPAQGTFGNMVNGMLRGLPFYEWDFSAVKNWKFTERYNLQFRAEFFNLLNRANYAGASSGPSTPSTFGAAQSLANSGNSLIGTGGPRQIQLALKLIF
jgi:hypothetical protein